MTLAACGGSGGKGNNTEASGNNSQLGNTGTAQDPTAKGPVTIEGATPGGTVTVLTSTGLTTTIDPTEVYYTDTSSLMSGLVVRSLTQYKYDPTSGNMVLVPDLATDLGTHNADYTEWKFTLRDGVKWENGDPVTAQELAFGLNRSFDTTTFPTMATYSNQYFLGGDTYKGPYTDKGKMSKAISVAGNTLTIKMASPFPDMPYWGTFPAMGAIPTGDASDPAKYKLHPLSDGPYMIQSYSPAKELVLVKNPNWDAGTDPARTQYPDKYVFKSGQDSTKIDQVMLADTGDGQTTLTYDDMLQADYTTLKSQAPERLVLGGSPCTYTWDPDYTKIKDLRIRQALAWAYPTKDVILASGLIYNVNAIPASSQMPPGSPGRVDFEPVEGRQPGQTDPAKAKALLTEANALNYQIKFLYRNDDPVAVKTEKVVEKALREAGFDPVPIAVTTADYTVKRADINGPENLRATGWCADWPSGATWFPVLLKTEQPQQGSIGNNYARFSEPEVDKKIADILKLPLDQQAAAWGGLDKYITQKYLPLIPTYYTGVAQAHGSKINGHFDDNTLGMPTWKDIWVSQ